MTSFMGGSIFLVATSADPMESAPTTAPAAAGFKDTDVNKLAEDDLATVYQDYEDFGAEESASRRGAEATLVAVVRLQNSMIFEGEGVPGPFGVG